ncbi:MAG: hypothetical protein AVDCRST_MAG19-1377 [uncultured Thermomicrobiales bacterium]|uniref:Mobile element protein n=1 Tax=uncultured Thermomicrobiales bacterium TaxID=1645740 RepID=A0A6J4UTQ4_9BACT|nr:MAG: hypothetical protein AVDCRST_MAG19-1377 [uncultured Thermomicrobiales bacterium]
MTDDGWAFVAPYPTSMDLGAPQRRHDLRWSVCAGAPWRRLPTKFPPRQSIYQQTQRRLRAGVVPATVDDLRALLRWLQGWADRPTAAILDRPGDRPAECRMPPRRGGFFKRSDRRRHLHCSFVLPPLVVSNAFSNFPV